MPKGLVVVVEDDPHVRRIYDSGLSKLGFTVLAASDGEEGLSLLSQHEPRVVVLDINLPGIDGIEVCRRSRSMAAGAAPVIFITSNEDVEILRTCVYAGGDDFLVKGGPMRTMLERVAYWARGSSRPMTERQRKMILERTTEIIEAEKTPVEAEPPPDEEEVDQGDAEMAFQDDARVQRIAEIFEQHGHSWPELSDRSVQARIRRFGYVTGLVNAAAQHSLEMKVRFTDYLRAAMVACGVADLRETETMLDNWHELYDNANFSDACVTAEGDFAESVATIPLDGQSR